MSFIALCVDSKIKVVTVCVVKKICNALETFVGRKSPGEEYFFGSFLSSPPLLSTGFLFPSFIIEAHQITFMKAPLQVSKQVSEMTWLIFPYFFKLILKKK